MKNNVSIVLSIVFFLFISGQSMAQSKDNNEFQIASLSKDELSKQLLPEAKKPTSAAPAPLTEFTSNEMPALTKLLQNKKVNWKSPELVRLLALAQQKPARSIKLIRKNLRTLSADKITVRTNLIKFSAKTIQQVESNSPVAEAVTAQVIRLVEHEVKLNMGSRNAEKVVSIGKDRPVVPADDRDPYAEEETIAASEFLAKVEAIKLLGSYSSEEVKIVLLDLLEELDTHADPFYTVAHQEIQALFPAKLKGRELLMLAF